MISYLLGLIVIAWMPSLAHGWWLLALLALTLLMSFYMFSPSRPFWVAMILGAFYAQLFGVFAIEHRLPTDLGRLEVSLQGKVTNIQPKHTQGYQSLLIKLTSPLADRPLIRQVRLGLYDSDMRLTAGDHVSVIARIATPLSLRNESTPDITLRDLRQGIDAKGYIKEKVWLQHNPNNRQQLFDWIQQRFSASTAPLMAALVLGDRQLLKTEQWDLLRVSGTVHLAVVSGLHLGVMTLTGLLIGRVLTLIIGYFLSKPLNYMSRFLPPTLAILLASFYLYFGGAGLPLQRAWIMAICLVGGMLFDRRPSALKRLKLALLLVTLLDPLAVLDLGFWLSFGLVAALLLLNRWRNTQSLGVRLITVQLFLTTVMLPMIVAGTGQLNLGGALANLWAIPFISSFVAILPITLPLSYLFSEVALMFDLWSDLFWTGLSVHSSINLQGDWPAISTWTAISAVFGVLLLWLPLSIRWFGVLFFMPMFSPNTSIESLGLFSVRVLDVGQGQSIIVQTGSNTLVYDLGARSRSGWMVAQTTLIPTLKDQTIDRVDLITSHSDIDHLGGLPALQESLSINRWYSGQSNVTGGQPCERMTWKQSGVTFDTFSLNNATNDNDESCVLRIDNEKCSLLIAGDLSAKAEVDLLQRFKLSAVTWLVLSHHGSSSSTSGYWLDKLSPKQAIVSRGRFNRFGHPSETVVNRVMDRDIPLFDTAKEGEIYLSASRSECQLTTYKHRFNRYWHSTD